MIVWEESVQVQFQQILAKVPVFLRPIAQEKVWKKAESLTRMDGREKITEKDLVDAFFAATPFGFHGPLKVDMKEIGIDFTKYGYSN